MSAVLERLVSALALGEGFQLGVLVVEDADGADHALGALMRLLATQIGRPALILRVGPASDLADPEALALAVLDPLQDLPPSDVVVLDASMATSHTEAAWEEVFRRLNSRRNGFARVLGRALILCVTPRLELALRREAPDLWSVRSARAGLVQEREGVSTGADSLSKGLSYDEAIQLGLPEMLAALFPDARGALPIFNELGYAPARLPLSDAADFWSQVLTSLDRGQLPGGIATLVRRLALDHPDALRSACARLPARVSVPFYWLTSAADLVRGPEDPPPNLYVETPWAQTMRKIVQEPPGSRILIVGERGSGVRAAWQQVRTEWEHQRRPVVVVDVVSLANPGGKGPWRALAPAIHQIKPTTSQIFEALAAGRRPTDAAIAVLPIWLGALAPATSMDPTYTQFLGTLLRWAIDELKEPCSLVVHNMFQREIPGFGELNDQIEASLFRYLNPLYEDMIKVNFLEYQHHQVPDHSNTRTILVGPATPDLLRAILDRRLAYAPPAVQVVLQQPDVRRVVDALASITGNPGAFLTWTTALLRRWPMPPPPDWCAPAALAALVPGCPDDPQPLLALGALLEDHPQDAATIAHHTGLDPGLLSRMLGPEDQPLLVPVPDTPGVFQLSPVAALLKPSVAAALSAHPGSGRF